MKAYKLVGFVFPRSLIGWMEASMSIWLVIFLAIPLILGILMFSCLIAFLILRPSYRPLLRSILYNTRVRITKKEEGKFKYEYDQVESFWVIMWVICALSLILAIIIILFFFLLLGTCSGFWVGFLCLLFPKLVNDIFNSTLCTLCNA